MGKEDPKQQSIHITKLFLPSWWIASYDRAVVLLDPSQSLKASSDLKIMPLFDASELSVLAVLLSKFQQVLLEGEGAAKFTSSYLGKSHTTDKQSSVLSKIIQSLGGIRFINNGITTNFVESETLVAEDDETTSLEINLSKQGEELVLGMVDGYEECLREFSNQSTVSDVLFSNPPVGIGKSLWLDLKPIEASILLRMEVAMQWELKWLHFNGTFGASIQTLFEGLDIKIRKNVTSEFSKKIKVLDRLGKKLLEHGLIVNPQGCNYYAFDQVESPNLIWKVSKESNNWDDMSSYFTKCSKFFQKRNKEGGVPRVLRKIAAQKGYDQLITELERLHQSEVDKIEMGPIILDKNIIISPFSLFCELIIRKNLEGELSLSDHLANEFQFKDNISDAWKSFQADLSALAGQLESILESKDGSIASRKFRKHLEKFELKFDFGELKNSQASRSLKNTEKRTEENIEKRDATSSDTLNKKSSQNKLTTHGLGSKLRRLANEELERLKRHNQSGYLNLQRKYFDSLDEKEREVWNEVVSKLRPDVRENTLRMRLIRFMVANPNLWGAGVSSSLGNE